MHLNNQRQCTAPPKMSQLDTSCEVFRWRGELSNGFCLRGAFLETRPSSEKSLPRLVLALGRAPKKSLPRLALTLARAAKNQYLGFLTRILQSLTVPAYGRFCVNNIPVSLLPLHLFLAYLCATHASAESSVPTRDLSAWAGGTWLPRSAS